MAIFRFLRFLAAAVVLSATAAGTPAWAERADRDKPLQVESDRLVYDDGKQVATFTGNVVATKGSIVIRGERLVLRQDASGNQHALAYGAPANFRQKREGTNEFIEGSGGMIEYDSRTETARIRQTAVLRKLDQARVTEEMFGELIVYEGRTDSYTVDGAETKSPSATNPGGRVRVVIQPKVPGTGATGAPASGSVPPGARTPLKPADSLLPPKTGERP